MKKLRVFGRYVTLTTFAIFVLFPIVNVVLSSFKTNAEINRVVLFPSKLNFENYINVLKTPVFYYGFLNSLLILFTTMFFAVIFSSIAGYALSRRKEKIFSFIYLFFLSAMMIPTAANMTALYSLVDNLGLLDTRIVLVLIYTAGAMPMGVMLYTGFIKSIPKELDESAVIDGCGYFRRFFSIILPLLKPIIVTQIITSSIGTWNDFFTPLLLIRSAEKKTLTFAVYSFSSEHATDWGTIFAMLTLAMIPPILIFLFSQKHFYKGVTAGAVKG